MTSVGSILGGAFRLLRNHPLCALVWGLLYAAAMIALFFAMRPVFLVYAEFIGQLAVASGKPPDLQAMQPYLARMQAAGGVLFLAEIALFAFFIMLFAATQRAVLRPAERGFFYLRFGGDELRLIGLAFFLAVCFNIASVLVMLILTLVVAIVGVASGSPIVMGVLIGIEFLALICATIYLEIRFSLAFPLTFLRRSFVIAEAWRLSRGRFWTLFGAWFLIGLVVMLLSGLLFAFAFAPFISELTQSGNNPEAIQLALRHQMEALVTIDARTVALAVGWALLGGISIALYGGAVATAARDLLAGDPALAEAGGEG